MTQPELETYLSAVREIGYTVVMTNGVFDLLHVGHVRYLQAAKDLGHVLVVAVNDDDSVGAYKPGRPINKLADRMAVLEALRSADAVVAFSEDTPERLIEQVRPDVLVKGGDYRPEQIAGREHAGRVLVLPHSGHSTTGLLNELAGPAAS